MELANQLAEISNLVVASSGSYSNVEIVQEPAILLSRLSASLSTFLYNTERWQALGQLKKWSYIIAARFNSWQEASELALELFQLAEFHNNKKEMESWLKKAAKARSASVLTG